MLHEFMKESMAKSEMQLNDVRCNYSEHCIRESLSLHVPLFPFILRDFEVPIQSIIQINWDDFHVAEDEKLEISRETN